MRATESEIIITIQPDGSLQFIYDDALASLMALGKSSTTRASHVEPDGQGGWTADMAPVNGPVLGPFQLRAEALTAERLWIEENVL